MLAQFQATTYIYIYIYILKKKKNLIKQLDPIVKDIIS